MQASEITDSRFGNLVPTIQGQMAFVPYNLPPKIEWTSELVKALSDADMAIGRLHGIGLNLPNPNLLIVPFVRKEAEMSSRIEGTEAEVRDLYLFEMEDTVAESKVDDVREVANYVKALGYALEQSVDIPVCLRMIKQLHSILLSGVRGEQDRPGQFRGTQNWIGQRG